MPLLSNFIMSFSLKLMFVLLNMCVSNVIFDLSNLLNSLTKITISHLTSMPLELLIFSFSYFSTIVFGF